MTDQAPWTKYIAKHNVHIVGEFENELRERFVIYRNENGDKAFLTGDEFDWQPGLPLLWGDFTLSEYERDQFAKILWPTFVETIEMAKAHATESSRSASLRKP